MAGIDNNTLLYLRGDSFKDLSPNPKSITNNGVAISDNCLEFGTAKRLIVGSSSEFTFGSGDFTVEVDAYLTAYSENDIFVSNNNFKDFYFNVSQGNSKLRLDVSYDPHYSENTVPLNAWNHLCVTRKDGIVYLFINGKLEFTGINNGVIEMTSPRIGYHDTYPNDKITGKLKNIRISNIARYAEDFTPPIKPYNSITINKTNQTDTNIEFNIEKLGQETINKVEVLVNGTVSETYTDNYDNINYLIDTELCGVGNNYITIRVVFDDTYTEELSLTHNITIDELPLETPLLDTVERVKLLTKSKQNEKTMLSNILTSKNVEISEEDKMSDLIGKVGELPSMVAIANLQANQEEMGNKISILEAENSALLESQKVQDRTIVENDMRMMDLEWALEDLITSINPTAKINLTEVFTMFGRSSTYFNQLKQMIEMENYDSKEDMERILNKYAAGSRPRITQEEYDQLFDLLYPPVYDIPTTIPEV